MKDHLTEGLRLLAKRETRVPPAALEARLLQEFHRREIGLKAPWLAWAIVAAATACAVWLWPSKPSLPVPVPVPPAHGALALKQPAPSFEAPGAAPVPPQAVRRTIHRQPRPSSPFMQIPFTEPLAPTDRAQLLRVEMPAAQLLSWGFPFSGNDPNHRIEADVLVGEDGLVRAVRFIQ